MSGALLALAGVLSLVPGQRVEYTLAAGDAGTHTIELQAGQFLLLCVDQEGTDLAVAVRGPDGSRIEVNATEGNGREPVSLLAEASGVFTLEVRVVGAPVPASYAIESDAPRAARAEDRDRMGAERALAEAAALVRKDFAESRAAALERFEAALRGWRALQDQGWEAQTLLQRAAARPALAQYRESRDDAKSALELVRRVGDRRGEARALLLIGESYDYEDEWDPAIELYEQALPLWRALGDVADEAYTLARLGWAHGERGEHGKFLEMARRVVDLNRQMGARGDVGWALMTLGVAQEVAGSYQDTMESWREARAIFLASGDRTSEALAIQRLGSLYATVGDYEKSLATCEEALAILRADRHIDGQITSLLTMGVAHSELGNEGRALELYSEALRISRESGERKREAYALAKVGSAQAALRQYEAARRHLEEALRLAGDKDRVTEVEARMSLGAIDLATGHVSEARASFRQAADLSRWLGSDSRQAKALYELGRLANQVGDLAEAQAQVEAAIGVIEGVRRRLTSAALRSGSAASARRAYELEVDVLMRIHRRQPGQGFDERALEAAEMARARGLLDQLSEMRLGLGSGVDPALLEEERSIRDRLGAALDRQLRLTQASPADPRTPAASRLVQSLTAEWDAVRARIKAKSPRFADLRDPAPCTAAEIREKVLDGDTTLLEYALGEERSYLWVMSRQALVTYELPARADVEQAARVAYAQLSDTSHGGARNSSGPDGLARLSRMVLGPAKGSLAARRVLVVADGALHYVPFAVLPDPDGRGEALLERHEVVSAPSASVVAQLRRETEGRHSAARTIAVIADPVFDHQDERVIGRQGSGPAPTVPPDGLLASALRSAGMEVLPRLPFTRREAQAILSLVPARQGKAALDFEASRAIATDAALGDFRFIHFATHGFLNSAQPELSGIVLSLVNRTGGDQRGFLTTTDVFNLKLNADMVVLSGCRTALGRELRGEGLVGLSRGFMYAGAPRLVASLWRVDDAATAELMKRLYRGILEKGLPPSAALRAAQRELMRRPRFQDPFYWAGFQLQGEWR